MNNLVNIRPTLDLNVCKDFSDAHLKVLFDYFADQVDERIQRLLISELMVRYTELSKQLDEKNKILKHYNDNLEALVQKKVKEISSSQVATIHALVKASEARDDDTGAHIERTSAYCRLTAERLLAQGIYADLMDKDFADNIGMASPLHDIGKIGIPDAILLKPGKLTPDEFEIMKTHVSIGYETLASVVKLYPENGFIRIGSEIARYHHEKWDGSGYMQGLAGENIPLSARIMALADVYDALRSRRVYKEPFTHEHTMSIIVQGRGSHFDPQIVDVFVKHNLEYCEIFDRLSAEQEADNPIVKISNVEKYR